MAEPSVSLIMLTYNQSAYVAEAVASALGQRGAPIEIVITDDCSRDETFAIIEKTIEGYSGTHKVIVNRNPENLGLAGNIEKAHELSSGDILIAAAGDDMSLPQRANRIRAAFLAHEPSLVCSYADVIGPDGAPVEGNFRTAAFYGNYDLEKAARSKSLYLGATGAWHRRLYETYGPMEPDAYEDLVMGFRAALEGKVHVIEEALVKYRLGQGLTSSDRYFKDITAFRRRRLKGFIANRAIMRQRIKDARHAGLSDDSSVLRTLRREEQRAELGMAYYGEGARSFAAQCFTHPLDGLYIWHSERRRGRKAQNRMAKLT